MITIVPTNSAAKTGESVGNVPAESILRPWAAKVLDPVTRRAGLDTPSLRLHDLRHSHGSSLLAAGVSIADTARRLRHKHPGITLSTYAHSIDPASSDARYDAWWNGNKAP